jgi:Tol biopolymer transport system component/imidazolonepropionase-like amidohydrolase
MNWNGQKKGAPAAKWLSLARKASPALALPIAAVLAVGPVELIPRALLAQENTTLRDRDATSPGLPLRSERTIRFQATEGTWVSLDVAPDGKTIVLDLLGDLYTMPISGGRATRITSGMAFDSQPRYSPDGTHIVFVSDRDGELNLWLVGADGSHPRLLTHERRARFTSPAWSSDGQSVLVSRAPFMLGASPYELWQYDIRGGTGVRVMGSPTPASVRRHALGAVASGDGRYIYYASYAEPIGVFGWNADFPMWQIARFTRALGEEDILTNAQGSAMRPLLSPDGSKLVFATRLDGQTGLRIRNLMNGEEQWLGYPVQRDDQESIPPRGDLLPGYAFTPDASALIIAYGGKIHRLALADGSDRVIPFAADVVQDLGPELYVASRVDDGPTVRARLIQGAEQSPDGTHLAFSALRHVYVMPLSGGRPDRLTTTEDGREYQPTWSPDGQWIAYVTWDTLGGQVFKMRADRSGAPVPLTSVRAFYRDPTWAPDGRHIIALRAPRRERRELETVRDYIDWYAPQNLELIEIPVEGGVARAIARARGGWQPHFAGDPGRVYTYSIGGLVSVRLDGTDRRTNVIVTGPSWGTEDAAPLPRVILAPDGRHALALFRRQLFLFAVPQGVGGPVIIDVSAPSVPLVRVSRVDPDHFAWADGGATVTWTRGSTFFRQSVTSLLRGAEQEEPPEAASATRDSTSVVLEVARDQPRGAIVLRGARVITMRDDEVISNADVVVVNNRVAAVGGRGRLPIPGDARIIDITGTTVMPGMIDTHAHWGVNTGVLDPQPWSLLVNLAYGVTAGRDPQTQESDMFVYQDLIDAGEMLGPRAFSTGPAVSWTADIQSADEAADIVAKYKRDYRTTMVKSYEIGSRRQRQFMVQACKRLGIMPTTEGGDDQVMDLTHVIDGFSGNEHNLPVVPLFQDVVELVARSGITYGPTVTTTQGGRFGEFYFETTENAHDDPKLRRFTPHRVIDARSRRPWVRTEDYDFPQVAEGATKILRAGGTVTVGSHGNNQGIGYHWNVWAMVMGGATPMEALRAATLNGAKALGYAGDLGSLQAGKLADLIVLDKDPLENIRNTTSIRYVMKNGRLYQGSDLTELWPRERRVPSGYFGEAASPRDPVGWWDDRP